MWSYGPLSCSRYPLYEIERQKGNPFTSVLEVILQNNTKELLYVELIWTLLLDKWESFARGLSFWFVFIELLILITLNLGVCSSQVRCIFDPRWP